MSDATGALWHYGVNNQQLGPVPESEIQQLLAEGVINARSYVWTDGMESWALLGDTRLAVYLGNPAGDQFSQSDSNAPPLVTGPAEAVRVCFQKYAGFTGRAARPEYWYFILMMVIGSLIAGLVDSILGSEFISLLFSLGILVPQIAVGVRRLHDTDRTGWWLLIGLIPLIGAIVLIVMFCQRGTPGANRFGPANPVRI